MGAREIVNRQPRVGARAAIQLSLSGPASSSTASALAEVRRERRSHPSRVEDPVDGSSYRSEVEVARYPETPCSRCAAQRACCLSRNEEASPPSLAGWQAAIVSRVCGNVENGRGRSGGRGTPRRRRLPCICIPEGGFVARSSRSFTVAAGQTHAPEKGRLVSEGSMAGPLVRSHSVRGTSRRVPKPQGAETHLGALLVHKGADGGNCHGVESPVEAQRPGGNQASPMRRRQ